MKVNMKAIAIILISSVLSACGGDLTVAGNDGISGTGITTAGRVTGFGSICVNGVKFEVNEAQFFRDGVNTTATTGESDFSVGEYITINGTILKADITKGIANEVIFENQIEGAVTEVSNSSDNNLSLFVLGQKVTIDARTILIDDRTESTKRIIESLDTCKTPDFIHFTSLQDLSLGNIVEVSGIKDANGNIKATSIKWKKDRFVSGESEIEIKGSVTNLNTSDKTFMLGSISVAYDKAMFEDFNAADLSNTQFVEVKSSSKIINNEIIAYTIKLKDEHLAVNSGAKLEIEGIVTRFNSSSDFDVNGVAVTTNSKTKYSGGEEANIELDSDIEVKGTVNSNGVLVAKNIEFED